MNCEHATHLLNARLDGELPPDEQTAIDAHLVKCADCRATADELRVGEAGLRSAFEPQRAAAGRLTERVVQAVRAEASTLVAPSMATVPARSDGPSQWVHLMLAAAAGFLVAVAIFRPWHSREVGRAPTIVPIAQMALATGPVEMREPSNSVWFGCPSSTPVPSGADVRTAPNVQCELAISDGAAVRMNGDTEISLTSGDAVELTRGQLWSSVARRDKPLRINSPDGTIVAAPQTQLDVCRTADHTLVTVVEGQAKVEGRDAGTSLVAGQQVRIAGGRIQNVRQSFDPFFDTVWINSLVAMKGPADPELAGRVNRMLAQVGAAKLSNLYEDELRRLGDAGVRPLLEYLASTRDKPNEPRRVTAARTIAEVGQSRWIPDLIALLCDPNPDVRLHAAQGLQRLTGRDQGLPPAEWQSGSWAVTCQPVHETWKQWWTTHRDRYPGAAREVPATSPPNDGSEPQRHRDAQSRQPN